MESGSELCPSFVLVTPCLMSPEGAVIGKSMLVVTWGYQWGDGGRVMQRYQEGRGSYRHTGEGISYTVTDG